MGMSLHIAKVYKVEYASPDFFYRENESINDLIYQHTNGWFSDPESPSTSDEIEVGREEFQNLIDWLRNPDNEDEYKDANEDLFAKGFTMNNLADKFEVMLKNSDPDNDYIRLSWF